MISQDLLAQAVLRPGGEVPGLSTPDGQPAGKRLDIYRNNVSSGLVDALAAGFPILARLLGARFRPVAAAFARACPPCTPVMHRYGDRLPDFLERHEFTRVAGYLPDIARLELALRASYHAADAEPVDPARLAAVPPEHLDGLRLGLAPALRVVRSRWPIHAIWQFHQPEGGPKPVMAAEDVVILRPGFDPEPHLLPPGGAAFLAALEAAATLGAASAAGAAEGGEQWDLSVLLALLLGGSAIVDLKEPR